VVRTILSFAMEILNRRHQLVVGNTAGHPRTNRFVLVKCQQESEQNNIFRRLLPLHHWPELVRANTTDVSGHPTWNFFSDLLMAVHYSRLLDCTKPWPLKHDQRSAERGARHHDIYLSRRGLVPLSSVRETHAVTIPFAQTMPASVIGVTSLSSPWSRIQTPLSASLLRQPAPRCCNSPI
jgi:hypothetical protein